MEGASGDRRLNLRTVSQGVALGLLGCLSVWLFLRIGTAQPFGVDFSCVWAGVQAALHHPGRLYDFAYISQQQGWPMGPGRPRPFIYPPSALPVFAPFGLLSFWVAYSLWMLLTGALFIWSALRAGAKWWMVVFPPLALVVAGGQVTFLVGGLVVAGLTLRDRRILAGVLFGIAAAVKPQLLVLAPIALAADRRWRTILAAGATAGLLCLASAAVWGAAPWMDWLGALPKFQHLVLADPGLVRTMVTPYSALVRSGFNGAWAYLLIPPVVAAVWFTFRRTRRVPERILALFGGGLLIVPYAMDYEIALLAPAVAAFLARTADRRWPAYLAAAIIFCLGFGYPLPLAAVLTLLGWAVSPSLVRPPRDTDPARPQAVRGAA